MHGQTNIKHGMCIKFCLKLGRTVTEIYHILKIIFKKWTVSRVHTFDWPSKGRSEGTSFNDAEHSKHSPPCKMYENVSWIKELVHENRHVIAHCGVSMAFVMKIAVSLDVMLYWVVWGELPASIFQVVKEKGLPWRWRQHLLQNNGNELPYSRWLKSSHITIFNLYSLPPPSPPLSLLLLLLIVLKQNFSFFE